MLAAVAGPAAFQHCCMSAWRFSVHADLHLPTGLVLAFTCLHICCRLLWMPATYQVNMSSPFCQSVLVSACQSAASKL